VSLLFFFFMTPLARLPLFFFKKIVNSYRVRPEQHLSREAVSLLRQRDVADACFFGFERDNREEEERSREKVSFFSFKDFPSKNFENPKSEKNVFPSHLCSRDWP
jgi:hypothetical protein